ncbi:heparinase II/III domain-containing protein [Cohnella hashimotonis]|uniref:Heparinase II/III family protein n=1 Tax=Cohnella hashimotonis TaxID=2826895 RepID=A0ABT6TQD3_9BACL|nr:heparinase II/III family protein [Cohnella hashimotonis]MDI4648965.1 heparinase II/III family protein [Cohnella hashimotonis]
MNTIRRNYESHAWCREAVDELRTKLRQAAVGSDIEIPVSPAGWWHQYVCPEHHTELVFDPMEREAYVYRCPYGCELSGEPYRGAWLVYRHQENAREALSAAAVYAATGELAYADLACGIVEAYAASYPRYPANPEAQGWMLRGTVFHQALTESIWAVSLLRAVLLVRDCGVDVGARCPGLPLFLALLEERTGEARRILVEERGDARNNYTAWLNASLSAVYAVRGDGRALAALLEKPGGLRDHLSIGVLADGFEFEGSTYYHLFVLRAYLIAAEMAERLGTDLYAMTGAAGQSFYGMLLAAADLAAPNGELPALHDGPYRRVPFAREVAEVMEIGWRIYRAKPLLPVLRQAYAQANGSPRRAGLEAVLFGEGEWECEAPFSENCLLSDVRGSRLYSDAGFAVGRQAGNPLSFVLDYGPHGGSHGHYDKLNLVLMHEDGFIAPERGMVPYGSALRDAWYSQTASHNTVTVGGRSQSEHAGVCLKFETGAERTYAWARSEGAYEGAVLDRHLWLSSGWLLDWFVVTLEAEDTVDCWLHLLREAPEQTGASEKADGSDGSERTQGSANRNIGDAVQVMADYSQITAERLAVAESAAVFRARAGDAVHGLAREIAIHALFPAGSELYRLQSPGTSLDPARPMAGLLQRQRGRVVQFAALYAPAGDSTELRRISDTEIEVRGMNGTVAVRLAADGLHVQPALSEARNR